MPPLRERKGDIAVLAQFFLDQFAAEMPAFAGKKLAREAIRALEGYSFPGNVRELKSLIERAACRDIGEEIAPEDLGLLPPDEALPACGSFHDRLEAFGRRLVTDALRQARGNQAKPLRQLGLPYHQFRYYLRKYASVSETCPHCGSDRHGGSDRQGEHLPPRKR